MLIELVAQRTSKSPLPASSCKLRTSFAKLKLAARDGRQFRAIFLCCARPERYGVSQKYENLRCAFWRCSRDFPERVFFSGSRAVPQLVAAVGHLSLVGGGLLSGPLVMSAVPSCHNSVQG